MPETLEEKLAKIERGDASLLKMFQQWIRPGADMHLSDMFLIGVIKRTLALSQGFRTHIKDRNFTCAAALVRMQLDTALRVYASTLVKSPEAYAKAVIHGEAIDKMKDRDGKRLTDGYLASKLNEEYSWVSGVYKELCNLVHFTSRHIFAGAATVDDETRTVHFQISAQDPPRPDEDYFEVVDTYYETMRVTGLLANSWQTAKQMQKASATGVTVAPDVS